MGQPTPAVLRAKRKVSDLLRTQISMSWSFPTITSFTRLATKEKEKVVGELSAKDVISNPIVSSSVFINIYSSPVCSALPVRSSWQYNLPKGLWERQYLPAQRGH